MNRAEFEAAFNVPRETMHRLDVYIAQLQKWSRAINLIGPIEADELWERHVSDSGQLIRLLPQNSFHLVDIGSGAGLPGLVLAILLSDRTPDATVTLVESDQRRCAFLRECARQTGTAVQVLADRVENLDLNADIVTARAVAPLSRLLGMCSFVAGPSTRLLLMKGDRVQDEIDAAAETWNISYTLHPSRCGPGTILDIDAFERRTG